MDRSRVQLCAHPAGVRAESTDLVSLLPATHGPALIPAGELPECGLVFSIMGGTEKQGGWPVPRKSLGWTTMGLTDLDDR
ncbi:MAG: hypothetical protein V3V08_17345 [Nannocystaceae bacterium]